MNEAEHRAMYQEVADSKARVKRIRAELAKGALRFLQARTFGPAVADRVLRDAGVDRPVRYGTLRGCALCGNAIFSNSPNAPLCEDCP